MHPLHIAIPTLPSMHECLSRIYIFFTHARSLPLVSASTQDLCIYAYAWVWIYIACFLECIYDDESTSFFWQAIFSPPTNVVSEAYANPGLSQVSESYFGSLKDQANHAPSLLTSDLDSQSKQHTNSLMKTPVSDNMPNDVPARQNSLGLWKYLDDDISLDDNPSSGILPTEQVTGEIPFQITEISSEWAYCTEDTKVKAPSPFPILY